MGFLSRLSQWLVATLEPYGAPGLMLIAICDSSFISLPEINDLALMGLSIRNPDDMWKYALMTVIGSIIGCTLLYSVGRKGGEAFLTKRFAAGKVARVRAWYDKYGMLAIIVPSLLPPPLPFKIFVLCAGAFRISWLKFMLAVGIGRSIRYFTEGVLAVWYGQQAIQMVKENSASVGLALATVIVIGTLLFVYGPRRRAPSAALLLPLLLALPLSGCVVRTTAIPENQRIMPSTPFTRAEALSRLQSFSQAIQTLQTTINLSGSTPELKEKDKIKKFTSLTGDLAVERPGRIFLDASIIGQGFEMRSNGDQYELYLSYYKQVHTGAEQGPLSTSSCKLGDTASQFINMRPRQIMDALVPDFRPLLASNSTVQPVGYTIQDAEDQREYFIVDFHDVSGPERRIVEKIYFDLSTPDVDIVRRQVFDGNSRPEMDTRFKNHEQLGSARVRYPMRFEVQFVPLRTFLNISVIDPRKIILNGDIDPQDFELGTHRNAEICKLEPAVAAVSQ